MKKRLNTACAAILFAGYAIGMPSALGAETGSDATATAAQIAHGKSLFISYGCGWCHEDGGRKEGKGPQLMDAKSDDEFILSRIATGSPGKMPAFAEALKEADFHDLLLYIRSLKPENP